MFAIDEATIRKLFDQTIAQTEDEKAREILVELKIKIILAGYESPKA